MQIEKTPVRLRKPKTGFHKRTKVGMINATITNTPALTWTGGRRRSRPPNERRDDDR